MNIGELEKKLADLATARNDVNKAQAVWDKQARFRGAAWRDRQSAWMNHLERELFRLREETL